MSIPFGVGSYNFDEGNQKCEVEVLSDRGCHVKLSWLCKGEKRPAVATWEFTLQGELAPMLARVLAAVYGYGITGNGYTAEVTRRGSPVEGPARVVEARGASGEGQRQGRAEQAKCKHVDWQLSDDQKMHVCCACGKTAHFSERGGPWKGLRG